MVAAHHAALSDGQLLRRFVKQRDEGAFAALVKRHGPLVLGACRRVLGNWHAAEDALQVTFLVLARRAGSVRSPDTLGPWLYGVAVRTARKAKTKEARRRVRERQASMLQAVGPPDGLEDLWAVLDEAVARLPAKYRAAFTLHHLQGLTVAEVARRLACPQGTVAVRLARAKERLRGRLARQGLALSVAALTTALSRGVATASVPTSLITGTVEAALRVAAAKTAGAFFAAAAPFLSGGFKAMSSSKVCVTLATFAVSAVVSVGLWQLERPCRGQRAGLKGEPGASEDGGRRGLGNAPANERYYAGGFRTTRGFEFRGDAPKAGSAGGGDKETGVPHTESEGVIARVKESPTGNLLFGLGVNSDAGLVGSIVLNERNFDILKPAHDGPQCQGPDEAGGQGQAGSGVRIAMPSSGPVPVALDFGFPVVREAQIFNFWLGIFSM
jgi:RNA polymerase sigma factor (sigma-70 family)